MSYNYEPEALMQELFEANGYEDKLISILGMLIRGPEVLEDVSLFGGEPPVHLATANGQIKVLDFLAKNAPSGIDIFNYRDISSGMNLAQIAIFANLETLKYILERVPEGVGILEEKDFYGYNCAYTSVNKASRMGVFEYVFERISFQALKEPLDYKDINIAHYAIAQESISKMNFIMENVERVAELLDSRDIEGSVALSKMTSQTVFSLRANFETNKELQYFLKLYCTHSRLGLSNLDEKINRMGRTLRELLSPNNIKVIEDYYHEFIRKNERDVVDSSFEYFDDEDSLPKLMLGVVSQQTDLIQRREKL